MKNSDWLAFVVNFAPVILLIAFWIFMMKQMQAGGNKLSFWVNPARGCSPRNRRRATFKDVAGIDEPKEELYEIIDFLKDPQKFQSLADAFRKACCSSGLRERARRCSHARLPARPTFRSSRFRAPISSRCSSAKVLLRCCCGGNIRCSCSRPPVHAVANGWAGVGATPTPQMQAQSASELAPGSAQLINPEDLVKILQSPKGEKPLVLNVGPHLLYMQAHIPGAEYIGRVRIRRASNLCAGG